MDYEIFVQAFNHEEQKQGGGGGGGGVFSCKYIVKLTYCTYIVWITNHKTQYFFVM